jgi:PAS domain S-box-containing protein
MRSFWQVCAAALMVAVVLEGLVWAASGPVPSPPLRLVGNATLPPYIFVQDEKPVGLVVDLAYALAQKAHLAIRLEPMEWADAQALVLAGQADALLQINPTPAREELYDFSDPLLESHFHLFRKTARVEIQGLPSLYGRTVGVERGGFPMQHLAQFDQIHLVVLPSWKAGFAMLATEQLDAIVVDRWVGEYELARNKVTGVTVVDPPLVSNASRIAVKKGNRDVLERINGGLREIERDGTRQRILSKWQAKEVVYLTRETIERVAFWAALGCIALLLVIVWRARAHSRTLKQINRELAERTHALAGENAERLRAEAALRQVNETLEQRVADRTAELRASEGRLRLFVEHAPAAIAMFDGQMRYLAVSQRWLQDYHLAGQPILGRSHYDVFPEVPERWKAVHRRCLTGAVEHAEEDPFTRADGQVQWLRWEVRPWHSAEGAIGGIVIFSEDITARKRAEEALHTTLQRSYVLLSSMYSAVLLVADEGRVEFANQAFCDRFGLADAPADLVGLAAQDMIAKIKHAYLHPDAAVTRIREILDRNQPVKGEELAMQDGQTSLRDFVPLNVEGTSYGRLWLHYDITERKRVEQALQQAKEELERRVEERTAALTQALAQQVAQAAQLRTVTGELALAEQRERRRLADMLHDGLQQQLVAARLRAHMLGRSPDAGVQAGAHELVALLEEAIAQTRSLSGELNPPTLQTGNLRSALDWLARWMGEKHKLTVHVHSAAARLPTLAVDVAVLLYQAVRELLLNVVKYAQVPAAAVTLMHADGTLTCTVADLGVGFDPTRLRVGGGTDGGVGLLGIRERLELVGGRLEIESVPGQGSRFTLTVPLGPR